MEIASISIGTGLDTSGAMQDFQRLGNKLSDTVVKLKVEVDDSRLTALNKHLAIKPKHLKEVVADFKRNVIRPTIDDRALTRLNKGLDETSGKLRGISQQLKTLAGLSNINVKVNTSNTSASSGTTQQNDKLADSIGKAVAKYSRPGIGSKVASVVTAPLRVAGNVLSGVVRGSLEGIGQQISKDFGSGLSAGINRELSFLVGSLDHVGKELGQELIKGLLDALGRDGDAVTKALQDILGKEAIATEGAAVRGGQSRQQQQRQGVARQQVEREFEFTKANMGSIKLRGEVVQGARADLQRKSAAVQKMVDDYAESMGVGALRSQLEESAKLIEKLSKSPQSTPAESQAVASQVKALSTARQRYTNSIEAMERAAQEQFKGLIDRIKEEDEKIMKEERAVGRLASPIEAMDLVKVPAAFKSRGAVGKAKNPSSQEAQNISSFYKQVFDQVAAESGVSANLDQIPKMVASNLPKGANAAYYKGSNTIGVSPDMMEAINQGKVTQKQVETLVHELRHAVQYGFGTTKGEHVAVKLIDPSFDEARKYGKKIESSTAGGTGGSEAHRRSIEADAYTFAGRNSGNIYQNVSRSQARLKMESAIGTGGGKLESKLAETQMQALQQLQKMSQGASRDIGAETKQAIASIEQASERFKASLEQLKNVELLPVDEIEAVQAKLQVELKASIAEIVASTKTFKQDISQPPKVPVVMPTVIKEKQYETVLAKTPDPWEEAKKVAQSKAKETTGRSAKVAAEVEKQVGSINIDEALQEAKKISANFWKTYESLNNAINDGDIAKAQTYLESIKANAARAKEDIKSLKESLGAAAKTGKGIGPQLANQQGQITRAVNSAELNVRKAQAAIPDQNLGEDVALAFEDIQAKIEDMVKNLLNGVEKINPAEQGKQAAANIEEHLYKFGQAENQINGRNEAAQMGVERSLIQMENPTESLISRVGRIIRAENIPDAIKQFTGLGSAAGLVLKGFAAFSALSFIAPMLSDFAKESLAAALEFEKFERQLNFVTGSASKTQATLKGLSDEARSLGGDFRSAIAGQAQLAAATKGTSLEGAATDQIGSAARQASAVFGLTTEEADRVNLALTQMASKGKISAEELRQQLGEVLPGAFQIFARSIGVTTTQLDGMLQRGEVGTDTLVKFASQLKSETSTGVAGAANSAQASLNRFNNEVYAMQVGFGKALLPVQSLGLQALTVALEALGVILPVVSVALLGFGTKALAGLAVNALTGGVGVAALGKGLMTLPMLAKNAVVALAPMAAQVLVFVAIADAISILGKMYGETEGASKDFATSATKGLNDYLALTGKATDETKKLADSLKTLPKSYGEDTIIGGVAKGVAGDRGTQFLRQREQDIGRGGNAGTAGDILRLFGMQSGRGGNSSNPLFQSRAEKEGQDILRQNQTGQSAAVALRREMEAALKEFGKGSGQINQVRGMDIQMRDLQARRGMLGAGDDAGRSAIDKQYQSLTKEREKLSEEVNALPAQIKGVVEGLKASNKQIEDTLSQGGLSPETQKQLETQLKKNNVEIERGEKSLQGYAKAINIAIEGAAKLESQLTAINTASAYRDNRIQLQEAQGQGAIALAQTNGQLTPGQAQSATDATAQATQIQTLNSLDVTIQQLSNLLNSPTTARAFGMSGLSAGSSSADIGNYISTFTGDKDSEEFKILQQAQTQKQQQEQLQVQSAQAQTQLTQSKVQAQESIKQTTKEINDFVKGIGQNIEEIGRTIEQANLDTQIQNTKNDLQRNLSGFSDRFFGDFIGGLDELIDLINEPIQRMAEAKGQIAQSAQQFEQARTQGNDLIRNAATGASGFVPGMASQAYNLQNPDGSPIRSIGDVDAHHDYQKKDGRNVYDMTLVDQNNNDRVAVPSAFNGTVDHVGNDPSGYGNFVDVKDLNGAIARFAHLAEVTVKAGQQVVAGQSLGLQGTTGGSTGVHLHAELPPQYAESYIQRLTQGSGVSSAQQPPSGSSGSIGANFSTNAAVSGGAGAVSLNDPTVKTAIQFYLGQGYSPAGAAYLVGNLIQESNLDPTAVGDGGNARGLSQVVGERQRGLPSSFMDQLAFVPQEFERDTPGITAAFKGNDVNAIRNAVTGAERYGVEGDRFKHGANLLSQLQNGGMAGMGAGGTAINIPGADTSAVNPAISALGASINQSTDAIMAKVQAQNEGSAIALRQKLQAQQEKLNKAQQEIIDSARQYSERYQDSIIAAFGDNPISQAMQQLTSDARESDSTIRQAALEINDATTSLEKLKIAREQIVNDPNLAPMRSLVPKMDTAIAEFEQQIDKIGLARDREQRILSDRRDAIIRNVEETGRAELEALTRQNDDLRVQQQQLAIRDPQLQGLTEGRSQRTEVTRNFEDQSRGLIQQITDVQRGLDRLKEDGVNIDSTAISVAENELGNLNAQLDAIEQNRDLKLVIIDQQQVELLRQFNKESEAALMGAQLESLNTKGDTFGANQLQFMSARNQLMEDYRIKMDSINALESQMGGQAGATAEKFDKMRSDLVEFNNVSLDNLRQQFPDLATTINQTAFTAFQGLSGSISGLIKGTSSLEDVFDSFASGIIDNLVQIGIQWASSKLFDSFMGGGKQSGGLAALLSPNASGAGGGGDTISSILSGGISLLGGLGGGGGGGIADLVTQGLSGLGFDNGGMIPGRYTGKPDQHMARVNPGEFIFSRQATAFHSPGKLNAMNNLQRFDRGGMVGSDRPDYKDFSPKEERQSSEPIKVQYEVTKINEVNYVTEEQLRRGMAATSQETEKRMNRSMRNSPSYRGGIGI